MTTLNETTQAQWWLSEAWRNVLAERVERMNYHINRQLYGRAPISTFIYPLHDDTTTEPEPAIFQEWDDISL